MRRNTGQQHRGGFPRRQCDRRRFLAAAGLLGTAALVHLVTKRADAQPVASPLRIGVVGPFTGPASRTGQDIRQGILMALDDARAEGELPLLIEHRQRDIELIWIDSASDPDRAAAAVTEAITQQHVAFLLGGWHSAVALAVMDAEAPFNLVHLGHLGEAQTIADKINREPDKYRGWFKGWPSSSKLTALYGEPLTYFRNQGLWQPANNKAAVMVEDTAYGDSWGTSLRASLQDAGFTPLPYDRTQLDQTDFHALLEHYRQEQVSLVAMTNTGSVAQANFVKQFRQLGVRALLLGHGLRNSSDWYELTGDSSNFVIGMDSAMPIALWQRWWIRRYRARFQQMPSVSAAGFHYDYTRLAVRVLNAAASLDTDKLISTIYRTPYRGVWHLYRFARKPGPHAVSANEVMTGKFMEGFFFPMVQLFGGEAKIIWPLKYADQRFQSPPWI